MAPVSVSPEQKETRNWAELPPNAISAVLDRLGHVDILTGAGQVSRSWRGAARDEPELWRRIDMLGDASLSHELNLYGMAQTAVRRSAGRCEAFWCEYAGDHDFLLYIADQAPSLKSLRLISCYNCDEGLKEAIVKFPLLQELELSLCSDVGESGVFRVVGKACPQLKRLRLSKDVFYDFESSHYDRDDEALGIATMHELRSLQLFANTLTNKGLTAILDNCRHLESLDIRHCFNVYMDNTLHAKCDRISTLRLILPRLSDVRTKGQVVRQQTPSASMDAGGNLSAIKNQVPKLIDDLRSYSLQGQRSATSEISRLAKYNMRNRIVIATGRAIGLLVDLLHSPDAKIQENAVTALLNLSIDDDNKIAILNAHAIYPLVYVLETGNPEAKENAAATLSSLSVIEETRVRMGQSGVIKHLVDFLGNGTPQGKKDAATALFNLSIVYENRGRIVQADAVKHLFELLDPTTGMVDEVVAVLANLTTTMEGRTDIGQARGIPALVEVVELGSAKAKENAATALLQLCTNSNRFCSIVLQQGAVPPLVALSQSGTPGAREMAQALLSYFRSQRRGNS